jgi:hypothetical protein
MVGDAGDRLDGEQIARGGLEEPHHRIVLIGRRVRYVDHDGRTGQCVGEPFAGDGVDPGVR